MTASPAQHLQETAAWAQEHFEISVPVNVSFELLEEILAKRLEIMISENFQQFIFLLYRTDISENRVKQILENAAATGADPYRPIASLIIERQLQKITSRATYKQDHLPDDEERW
jgi:Asp-tRNA(Asn)/Glu-tRNA(Gln) amidotransferase B subunit